MKNKLLGPRLVREGGPREAEALLRRAGEQLRQEGQAWLDARAGCPPIWRIGAIAYGDWSAGEAAHVAGCSLCQRAVRNQYAVECPGERIEKVAVGSPVVGALRMHAADGCQECSRRLQRGSKKPTS